MKLCLKEDVEGTLLMLQVGRTLGKLMKSSWKQDVECDEVKLELRKKKKDVVEVNEVELDVKKEHVAGTEVELE